MKIIKVNIDGINEMKYPDKYNQDFSYDCIHVDRNEMINRGIAKIINAKGAMSKSFDSSTWS